MNRAEKGSLIFFNVFISKGIEDASRRQANEAPEHRGTM